MGGTSLNYSFIMERMSLTKSTMMIAGLTNTFYHQIYKGIKVVQVFNCYLIDIFKPFKLQLSK